MPTLDWLDVVIVAIVLLAAVGGYRRGAASQLLSYGGLGLGLIIGIAVAPLAVGLVASPLAKAVVALVVILGAGAVLSTIGRRLGLHASRLIRRVHLSPLNAFAGAAVGAVIALVVCVAVANLLVHGPSRTLRSAIAGSAVIARVDRDLPFGVRQLPQVAGRAVSPPLSRLVTGVGDVTRSAGRGADLRVGGGGPRRGLSSRR